MEEKEVAAMLSKTEMTELVVKYINRFFEVQKISWISDGEEVNGSMVIRDINSLHTSEIDFSDVQAVYERVK